MLQNEEEKKRAQLEILQRLKDMAGKSECFLLKIRTILFYLANDTLDLSQLTIDELRKAIEIPKEIRTNPTAIMAFQMDEIRKLV